MSQMTHSLASRLAFSTISPLFVDRFGRSFQLGHLELDKEDISDGWWNEKMHGIGEGFEFQVILDS